MDAAPEQLNQLMLYGYRSGLLYGHGFVMLIIDLDNFFT